LVFFGQPLFFLARKERAELDKIKTKTTIKNIKVLDKTADAAHRAKNAFVRTKEQAEQTQQTGNGNYVEYAGDKVKEGTQTVVHRTMRFTQGQGKKTVRKIRERRKSRSGSFHSKSSKSSNGSSTGQSPNNEASEAAGQNSASSGQNELAKRRFFQNRPKQANRLAGKTVKETAKGTIKTSRKTIKTAGNTAKTIIKTTQAATKTATRTARVTAQATQRAIQAARTAAIAARAMVKAVVAAVRAAIAAIRSLITLIAAGGWVVIVIILIICLLGFLINSPLGIFFSGENKDADVTPVASVVQEVNADFDAKISAIEAQNPDVDSVQIDYPGSADNTRIDNWEDVVAVFAVKTAMDSQHGMDVATIDNTRADLLKSVFWDMNTISYKVETEEQTKTVTVKNEDGTTSEDTVTTSVNILHTTVISKTAEQQAEAYGFNADQKEVVNEMLSAEFRPMMFELLGIDSSTGLTPDQLQSLYNSLPPGQFGTKIVQLALSRLGDPYSEPKAGQDDYTDCSYLTQWCYEQVGISLPRTAADQAQYCVNNHETISPNDLEPGDLVFFSLENNGRFMNISHVAVYAGNGYIVDASSARGQVVYRELFGGQVLYGRP
jgi:cell wall-associated NlpC family hydrolase